LREVKLKKLEQRNGNRLHNIGNCTTARAKDDSNEKEKKNYKK
jgi:hypothetical protein